MSNFNFKKIAELERKIDIPTLLDEMGVGYLDGGDTYRTYCPLHNDSDNITSGAFYKSSNFYQCFAGDCTDGKSIPFLQFIQKLYGLSYTQALNKIKKYLNSEVSLINNNENWKPEIEIKYPKLKKPIYEINIEEKYHNFYDKAQEHNIEYLKERWISNKAAFHFGIRFRNNYWLKNRIVFPIKNDLGEVVGYSGRHIYDEEIGSTDGDGYIISKYKHAPKNIAKKNFLYNLDSVTSSEYLIVVEGFPATWKLYEFGFPAGAVMGSSLSEEQAYLICRHFRNKKIYLCFDGDEAGWKCTKKSYEILRRYVKRKFLFIIEMPLGIDPGDITRIQMEKLIGKAKHYE